MAQRMLVQGGTTSVQGQGWPGSPDSEPGSIPLCNAASWGQGRVGSERTEVFITLEAELRPLTSNVWDISKSNRGDRATFDLFVNIMQASVHAL